MQFLGIELGSTRIKAVLIDEAHRTLATGGFNWENRLENGIWTYHLEDVWQGLQAAYRALLADYGAEPAIGCIGISAMMHGYLPFDAQGNPLAAFRTWRNTMTAPASAALLARLGVNIPQRWSAAHLYQAVLNGEPHVKEIAFLTTLSGYVHWKLTGRKVLGVGDASGMFPIDSATGTFDAEMANAFDAMSGLRIATLLPEVLQAGARAGSLTEEGARLLDPSGKLRAGVLFCPPEGDAGTGMVANNSVAARTGNVSAGTSIFAMVVLEQPLSGAYPEIDLIATPCGKPVAMAHCNNCSSDIDAWVRLFGELLQAFGVEADLYDHLFCAARQADPDCGGLLSYNYLSGEHVVGLAEGRPLLARMPGSRLSLANFSRSLLFSAIASLRIGMDILIEKENIRIDRLSGHGGLFKTPGVVQQLLAAALGAPVYVMESAGEGGAWGIAVLAAYLAQKSEGEALSDYMTQRVFAQAASTCAAPAAEEVAAFDSYMERYKTGLEIERAAVAHMQ
ncbi:MAG: ATPase [Oscillospiraceae bacterium]|jgi:sugar (pentulose or hexulose) kinase|nr:ATPase [Oscillospiraceae bacterium]